MRKKDFRGLALGMMMLLSLSGCSADAPADVERTQSHRETTVVAADVEETATRETLKDQETEKTEETVKDQETKKTEETVKDQETEKTEETVKEQDTSQKETREETTERTTEKENNGETTIAQTTEQEQQKETTAGCSSERETLKETLKETTAAQTSKQEQKKETTTIQVQTTEKETKKEQESEHAEKESARESEPQAEEEEAPTQDMAEKPVTTKPSVTKPSSTQSSTTKSETAMTTTTKPTTTQVATKPAATKPAATKPPVTQPTTTAAQVTAAPTTAAPTTAAPTTAAPTTAAPTMAAPTTAAPTTVAPTTAVPTAAAPTTAAPTTAAPTTEAPTTEAPTTSAASCGDGGAMRTSMTSVQFRDEMGIGINLGNTMDAYWASDSRTNSGSQIIGQNIPANYETCWGGKVVTQSMIDSLKASGFQTVRIPVYWGNMMAEDGTFTIDRDYLARVAQIIDYCRQDGMYVVINIHHYDEYIIKNYPKDQALTIFKNLWSQIAAYYKDYSDYLIFEGFNENVGSTYSGEALSENQIFAYANALNQTFVDAVRGTGGNNASRMLIVSGYWTNIDKTTDSRFKMPTDSVSDRLMVSVHYVDNACYWSNNVGGQSWLDYSISQCELLKKAFTDKGIVVFVGECTASYESDRIANNAIYKDSASCTAKMISMIMDYGFVPVFWDTTGNFYADSTSQAVTNSLQSALQQVKNN